jgi:SAM-dependent methyltransferase
MNIWDDRYREPGFAYGVDANDFLAAHAAQIPSGRVLCLAEGEGRNAVFLAKRGFDVHAVDLSRVGLEKASECVTREGVHITTEVADLGSLSLEPSYWHGIVSIFAHMPAKARKALNSQVVQALRPGGIFMLEAFTSRQLAIGGVGGPSGQQLDFFMSLEELRKELAGLSLLHAQELDREVNEGRFHQGRSAVVQLIAQKGA